MSSRLVRISGKNYNKINEIIDNENKKSEYRATQIQVIEKLLNWSFEKYKNENSDFEFLSDPDSSFNFGDGK